MYLKSKTLAKTLPLLPRYSYSIHGKQMEPITLILLGHKNTLVDKMVSAGWYESERITPITTLRSGFAAIFNKGYRTGPMWPAIINGKRNRLGFEMPTQSDTYRRRHHMRLWETRFRISNQPVWVGTISYEHGAGLVKHSLLPTHHISPALKLEEEYLARTLDLLKPMYAKLAKPEEGLINTGDPYIWDGKVLVVDLSK
jgi:hypothetical protein